MMNPVHGNILLIANFESNVGYAWWLMETFWAEIARFSRSQGRQCFLIYPKITRIPATVGDAPITVLEHDFADRSGSALRTLRDLIQNKGITSVYLTDGAYVDRLYARLRRWGVRRIVLHDHSPGELPPISPARKVFKQLIHALSVFSCDHYIGVSRFVHDRFITRGRVPHWKCSYVLNGINPITIRPEWKEYTRQQFGFPDAARIIVSTGRASLYKGIDFIIRCANHLIHEVGMSDVYFLHCGDGPDKELFSKMIADSGLEKHFILAGKRDDLTPILQSCHIALHASHGEAFSLSILEYLSAGLATLAPRMCGNGEAIEDGITGYLYPPEDLQAVAALIEMLLKDDSKRRLLGEAARRRVAERFTIDRMKAEFVSGISKVL
jgi:glycosyltransferase involved in cell wall biosynthesis